MFAEEDRRRIREVRDRVRSVNRIELEKDFVSIFLKPFDLGVPKSVEVPVSWIREIADVAGFYAAFGLKSVGELPNNIISGLEFMGFLCLKEAYASAHGLNDLRDICKSAQAKFLRGYLSKIVARALEISRMRAKLPIYPTLLEVIHSFIRSEEEELNDGSASTSG